MREGSLIWHLGEFRFRFLSVIAFFSVFFLICLFFSPAIINAIISSVKVQNISLVSLTPFEFISTQFKVAFLFAFLLSSPILIFHLIKFINPALKKKESSAIKYILPAFILLFLLGASFFYFLFLKVALFFLARLSTLANVQNLWSVNKFVSFIICSAFAFGIIFQMPLLALLLARLRILDKKLLRKFRPHIYVLMFIIAAVITPTQDAVSQIIVAVPLVVLFELSYLLVSILSARCTN